MRHKVFLSSLFLLFLSASVTARESILLDDEWIFSLAPDSASTIKPFTTVVNLPHDWSIGFPFDRNAPMGNDGGYLPSGVGVYVKDLNISAEDIEKNRYTLLFDGVYERWTLKVNGDSIGYQPYGYSSAFFDITPALHPGKNVIEVIADNSHQKNCRWYSGSGIYRHVHLIKTGQTYITPWSLYITTPQIDADKAQVKAMFSLRGFEKVGNPVATLSIIDQNGKIVAKESKPVTSSDAEYSMTLFSPELWSPESPNLYTLRVAITSGGKEVDSRDAVFGVRSIEFSPEKGFLLNGTPMVLNGACVHHDNGILGAAAYDAAEARKVKLLKDAGFNAVRTSHNPPAPAFLDECDRQGLLVIDEAFDGWREAKNKWDYHNDFDKYSLSDVGAMVKRDRNHPSVIAWSIGNEVIERKKIEIVTTARRLASECHRLDPTRPVTSALCAWDSAWEIYDPLAETLEIVGYNYMIHKSETDHERCPERIMWQTESYPADAFENWKKVTENPYIIGDFVWTGIDYLGESGIGRYFYKGQSEGEHYHRPQWPWHGAYCGDIDITGWRKPISHYRDFLYNDNRKLYMAVREPNGYNGEIQTTKWSVWPTWESWNWAGHEGKPIEVEVLSRYPKVRLYLNDNLVEEKSVGKETGFKAVFSVPYTPGTLRAEGCDSVGNTIENTTIATTGKPSAIRLIPDKTRMKADNQDVVFVIAEIVDSKGNVVPDNDACLSFKIKGDGNILATGSANLTDTDSYSTPRTHSWKGRAIVAVKSGYKPGKIKLSATSQSLKPAEVTLSVK